MHFVFFSLGQGTEWGYFYGLLKFQIFFGVLNISDIFGGERKMLGLRLRMNKMRVPTLG